MSRYLTRQEDEASSSDRLTVADLELLRTELMQEITRGRAGSVLHRPASARTSGAAAEEAGSPGDPDLPPVAEEEPGQAEQRPPRPRGSWPREPDSPWARPHRRRRVEGRDWDRDVCGTMRSHNAKVVSCCACSVGRVRLALRT